jgi:hypothetical protein
MCDECARLRSVYEKEVERLAVAQRELARYEVTNGKNIFDRLWKECESALKALWNLREEMARHRHTEDTLSAHG